MRALTSRQRRALQTVGMWDDMDGLWRSNKGPLTPKAAKAHAVSLAKFVLRALSSPDRRKP